MTSEANETSSARIRTTRSFLGWQMVAVAFVSQFLSNGVTFSAVGNFILPMSEALGVSQTRIGIAPGILIASMGIFGPFVGRALDRGWARWMMTGGALATGLGLILIGEASSYWQVALCWAVLVCPGAACFGALPSMTLVSNWFVRRRGLALGMAIAGATFASWFAPATAQWIMDEQGWRTSIMALGALTVAIGVPIFSFFVIVRPESVGQGPDGDSPSVARQTPQSVAGPAAELAERAEGIAAPLSPGEIARNLQLWLAAAGFGLVLTSPVVLVGLLVPYGTALGFSQQDSNFFFAAMVPFSLAGKIVLGGLADIAPLKPSIALVVVVNILVWGILSIEPGYALFVATGALYGIGIGGAAPLQGVLMGRLFGRENFGTASGIGGMLGIPLLVAASIGSQVTLGATGSYQTTFLAQAVMLVVGGVLLALVRIPKPESARA